MVECVHYEKIENIDGVEYGTCIKCGQVRRYERTLWYGSQMKTGSHTVIRPGRPDYEHKEGTMTETEAPPAPRAGTKGRLTNKQRAELAEIGVDAFIERYGYTRLAKSVLTQARNKYLAHQQPAKPASGRGPHGRLTNQERSELLRIGVKAFAAKHGYKATGALKAARNKALLRAKELSRTVATPVEETRPRSLLEVLVEHLPAPGTQLNERQRGALSVMLAGAVELSYRSCDAE